MKLVAVLALVLVLAAGGTATAGTEELYRSRTLVTGQLLENRLIGIAECFEHVLAKVSGDPTVTADPGFAAVAATAAALVAGHTYRDRMGDIPIHDEQGTRDRPYFLTVEFKPEGVDAALARLGRKPWLTRRPTVVAFVAVKGVRETRLITVDPPGEDPPREAVEASSELRGLALSLPTRVAAEAAGATFDALPGLDAARLAAAGRALGGEVVLAGRIAWSEKDIVWVAAWRLVEADRTTTWSARAETLDEAFRSAFGSTASVLAGLGLPR